MRNSTRILMTLGAVLAFLPVSNAMAQRRRGLMDVSDRHQRHGAWITLGVGAGTESFRFSRETVGYNEGLTKPSFWLAAGGTVNPHLRLGGEINGWVNEFNENGEQITESLVAGLLTGQVFPVRELGLFVKGGLGISRSGTDIAGGFGSGETGFSYLYGAGYELRLARNFFLTPTVSMMHHASSPNRNDPEDLGTLHERVWLIGVGLTFQPGR